MRSRCPVLLATLLAAALFATGAPVQAYEPYGRLGISLKTGEAAGPMGIQLSWNFSPHWQLCGGGGGTVQLSDFTDHSRTDSYFLLGKYYFEHAFLETGYSLKVTTAENLISENVVKKSRSENGIPIHLGYEFGKRLGFYFAASVGYHYVFGGGGKQVTTETDPKPGDGDTSAESGPTAGLSVGYYLW